VDLVLYIRDKLQQLAAFGVFFCKGGNSEYELQVCCLMAGQQLGILDLFPFVGYKEAQEILRLLIQIFAGFCMMAGQHLCILDLFHLVGYEEA
jgi:hypothetical protein